MSTINRFEDIVAWQKARSLHKSIIEITKGDAVVRDFRFVAQWRSSCGSVMDNIAEGFDRQGNKEFLQFLSIARGSVGEVQSQCYRALDSGYILEDRFTELYAEAREIKLMMDKLMNYLRNSDIKGYKYKK